MIGIVPYCVGRKPALGTGTVVAGHRPQKTPADSAGVEA